MFIRYYIYRCKGYALIIANDTVIFTLPFTITKTYNRERNIYDKKDSI